MFDGGNFDEFDDGNQFVKVFPTNLSLLMFFL